MTDEYDFEMVKRAYAEMARRAQEKDEAARLPSKGAAPQPDSGEPEMRAGPPTSA